MATRENSIRDEGVTSFYRRVDPAGAELVALGVTLGVGVLALAYGGEAVDIGNILLPSALIVIFAIAIRRMLRLDAANLWTPILWMRVAVMVYFGFGSLVPLFASAAARNYIESFFQFFSNDVLKLNVVIVAYLFCFLAAVKALELLTAYARQRGQKPFFNPEPAVLSLFSIGLIFLAVGSFVTFGVLLPSRFGLTNVVIPNTINEFATLSYVGLFFLGSWAFAKGNLAIVPVLFAGAIYAFLGLISFSKTDTLFPVVLLCVAFIFTRPSVPRILAATLIIVASYFGANQIVQDGREIMIQRYNSLSGADFSERMEIMRRIQAQNEVTERGAINYGVTRLSYVPVGSFVIAEYDRGMPGDSTRNALITPIPRFIWPGKPIITDVARELSYAASGIYDNSVSPTLPADAYWNGGWLGVILWGTLAGTLLWMWSCYSVAVLRNESWHLFAIVLMGARTGSRIDGFLVVDLLGVIPIALVAHFLISRLNTLLVWSR